jgi:L-lactate dehydrogenase complex protein LldF
MTAASRQLPILDVSHGPAPDDAAEYFQERSAVLAYDPKHRRTLRKAIGNYSGAVSKGKSRFLDHEAARRKAAAIKREAILHLDRYLEEFERNVIANGGVVHWAQNGDEARDIILDIAKKAKVTHVVKGKSMATEEIHLNDALEAVGVKPVETDLGEFICQLRHEPPYHIVTPVMHLTKEEIAATFEETLHTPPTDDASTLATACRDACREQFASAVMGITGGNFLVADVGMVALTENEGNARLSFSMPDVHVALVGIEKVVPKLEDLALLWPMLSTSGTGQHITCYNSLVGGPRREGEHDGPREFHVVLMDAGRTRLLADPEQRESLQCIRCGACLNACPIFQSVGGHTYGTTYQGPIGAVITPHLRGLKEWNHLSYASSLCGRCTEVCPVKIDLHHHLLRNRRNAVQAGFGKWHERFAFRVWLWFHRSAFRFRLGARLARIGQAVYFGLRMDRWRFGNPLFGWTKSRTLPRLASESFRDWWKREGFHESRP